MTASVSGRQCSFLETDDQERTADPKKVVNPSLLFRLKLPSRLRRIQVIGVAL